MKNVMDEDWKGFYQSCDCFHELWEAVNDCQGEWPDHVQLMGDKLYRNGKLCIPMELVDRIIMEHHKASGHSGVEKMHKEMMHRYEFPPGEFSLERIRGLKRQCQVCQACDVPNWGIKGPMEGTPYLSG